MESNLKYFRPANENDWVNAQSEFIDFLTNNSEPIAHYDDNEGTKEEIYLVSNDLVTKDWFLEEIEQKSILNGIEKWKKNFDFWLSLFAVNSIDDYLGYSQKTKRFAFCIKELESISGQSFRNIDIDFDNVGSHIDRGAFSACLNFREKTKIPPSSKKYAGKNVTFTIYKTPEDWFLVQVFSRRPQYFCCDGIMGLIKLIDYSLR